MRRSLLAYALSGTVLVAMYAVGGYSGWWRGLVRWNPAVRSSNDGGSGGGVRGGGGWTGGSGGFRGGK